MFVVVVVVVVVVVNEALQPVFQCSNQGGEADLFFFYLLSFKKEEVFYLLVCIWNTASTSIHMGGERQTKTVPMMIIGK